jgi:hypothetical protein
MKTIYTLLFALTFSLSIFSQGNGYLGISMEKDSEEGVRISEVLENGAAFVYGLQQNDILLSVNGVDVNTAKGLKSQITEKNWGQTISLLYKRDGHTKLKDVVLGNRANRVTYHVRRRKANSSYEWSFDENTWITVLNGNATRIVKKNENGVKEIHEITEGSIVPQAFLDLDDKLEIIEAIEARNAGKRYFPSVTVYIKTYTEPSKTKVNTNLNVELKAFPNPSLGEFQFSLNMDESTSKDLSWQVFDVTGKKITEGNLNEFSGVTTQKLDLTNQGAGVYLLRVINDKQVMTERLVVK